MRACVCVLLVAACSSQPLEDESAGAQSDAARAVSEIPAPSVTSPAGGNRDGGAAGDGGGAVREGAVAKDGGPIMLDVRSSESPFGGPPVPTVYPDASVGYVTNLDTLDASCNPGLLWVFPKNELSSYCGSILDACKFVCGTPYGCTVDPDRVNGSVYQFVSCPSR